MVKAPRVTPAVTEGKRRKKSMENKNIVTKNISG